LQRFPEDIHIHEIIAVDEAVSHSNDFRPRDVCMFSLDLKRNMTCSFPYQFDQVSDSQTKDFVLFEIPFAFALSEADCLASEIPHVSEPD